MLWYQAEVHTGLLIDLITSRSFQIQQARQQVCADIQGHDTPHDATDFGIKEWRYQLLDETRTGNVIGFEDQVSLGFPQFHGVLQLSCLPALSATAMSGR